MSDQPSQQQRSARRLPSPVVLACLAAIAVLLPPAVSLLEDGMIIADVSQRTWGIFAITFGSAMAVLLAYIIYVFYMRR
jgi:hypothetical protein